MGFAHITRTTRRAFAASLLGLAAALTLGVPVSPAEAGYTIPSLPQTNPVNFTPQVVDDHTVTNAGVRDLQDVRGRMYAGGEFHTVTNAAGTTSYVRDNIFAFNRTTGSVADVANLSANGAVYALELSPDGRYLYVGGAFTRFGGVAVNHVAKFDLDTYTVVQGFHFPYSSGLVSDLQLVSGRLVASGNFTGGIVAVSPDTGAASSYFDGVRAAGSETGFSTRIYRFAVNPAATRMVVIGSFTSIGGQARQEAAMVNLGTTRATVSPWTSGTWNRDCIRGYAWYTRDVDWAPDGSFFVIGTSGGAITNTYCDTATRWAPVDAGGQTPAWIQYTGGDTIHSVAVTNRAIFLGGHFRWLDNPQGRNSQGPGAAHAQGLGAIDIATGRAIRTWNPTKSVEGGHGAYILYPNSQGLWVGHFEREIGHELHQGVGLLPY